MEKWGGMRKKVGEGGEGRGMRNGGGVDREIKVEQGVKNKGSTNRKSLHAVQKGECGGKSGKDFPKNRPKSDPERGKTRKKWASQGKKRGRFLEKVSEIESKTGKSGKNGDFGAKKVGWGRGEKMGFTADFARL